MEKVKDDIRWGQACIVVAFVDIMRRLYLLNAYNGIL